MSPASSATVRFSIRLGETGAPGRDAACTVMISSRSVPVSLMKRLSAAGAAFAIAAARSRFVLFALIQSRSRPCTGDAETDPPISAYGIWPWRSL